MPSCSSVKRRFILETLFLWVLFCLPINLLTLVLRDMAPRYDHGSPSSSEAMFGAGSANLSSIHDPRQQHGEEFNESELATTTSMTELFTTLEEANSSVAVTSTASLSSPLVTLATTVTEVSHNESHLPCYEDVSSVIPMLVTLEFWVSGIILFITAVLGIVGNILTILVLICYEARTSFNKLLMYLTVVDLLLLLIFATEFAVFNVFIGAQPFWYKVGFPYFIHPLKHTLLSLCIFLMVAVSSERCQAICHPLRERPSPVSYLVAVLIMAISLNARKFLEFQLNDSGDDYETTSIMEYPSYIIISNTWQELFVTGVMPFLALVYCNIRIYCKIRESSKHEEHRHVGGQSHYNAMRQVTIDQEMTDTLNETVIVDHMSHSQRQQSFDQSTSSAKSHHKFLTIGVGRQHQCRSSSNGRLSLESCRESSEQDEITELARRPNGTEPEPEAAAGPAGTRHNKGTSVDNGIMAKTVLRKHQSQQMPSPNHSVDSQPGKQRLSKVFKIRCCRCSKDDDDPDTELVDASRSRGPIRRSATSSSRLYPRRNTNQLNADVAAQTGSSSSPYHFSHNYSSNSITSLRVRGTSMGTSHRGFGGTSGGCGARVLRKRHEKSVLILVLIVVVFLMCHSFRLGVQTFQTLHSDQTTKDHYEYCAAQGRLNLPATFMVLISFNNLFLVINSSINFIIYCAVRKPFRISIVRLLCCRWTGMGRVNL